MGKTPPTHLQVATIIKGDVNIAELLSEWLKWRHLAPRNSASIGSENGLVPPGNQPSFYHKVTCNEQGAVPFNLGQFDRKCPCFILAYILLWSWHACWWCSINILLTLCEENPPVLSLDSPLKGPVIQKAFSCGKLSEGFLPQRASNASPAWPRSTVISFHLPLSISL